MKIYILFIIGLILFTNTLVANININRILGISAKKQSKEIVVIEREKKYIAPKKSTTKNSQIDELIKYAKIKKNSQEETSYGLKMGYKISESISISVDVLAQVDLQKSKIKSKEASLHFALSL